MRIAFAGLAATLQVPDSSEFETALRAAAPGWPFAVSQACDPPIAVVTEQAGAFLVVARGKAPMRTTAIGAACSAVVALADVLVEERPDRLCFHCGAALFGGRLVVFPNRYRAGKSTLVAKLAAMGHTVFGDDILPLSADDSAGIALGLAPRLRNPLPPDASSAFQDFVKRHSAASDSRYSYLRVPYGRLAPHEAAAPLGAIVLLERGDQGRSEFRPASKSAVLRALIERNFAREPASGELLNRIHRLMDRLPRLTLRYSDFEDAADLVAATFASWPPQISLAEQPAAEDSRPSGSKAASNTSVANPFPPELKLVGKEAVTLQRIDDDLFLAEPDKSSIYQLNAIGAGLWNLLAEPISQTEAIDVLCGAFPHADKSTITCDVASVLAALFREGLIVAAK